MDGWVDLVFVFVWGFFLSLVGRQKKGFWYEVSTLVNIIEMMDGAPLPLGEGACWMLGSRSLSLFPLVVGVTESHYTSLSSRMLRSNQQPKAVHQNTQSKPAHKQYLLHTNTYTRNHTGTATHFKIIQKLGKMGDCALPN